MRRAGLFYCRPGDRRMPIFGRAILFSMWQPAAIVRLPPPGSSIALREAPVRPPRGAPALGPSSGGASRPAGARPHRQGPAPCRAAWLAGSPGVTAFASCAALLPQEQLAAAAFFSPSRTRSTAFFVHHLPPPPRRPAARDRQGAWAGRGCREEQREPRRAGPRQQRRRHGPSRPPGCAARPARARARASRAARRRWRHGGQGDLGSPPRRPRKAIACEAAPAFETCEKGHGRIERCPGAVGALADAEWDGAAALPERR